MRLRLRMHEFPRGVIEADAGDPPSLLRVVRSVMGREVGELCAHESDALAGEVEGVHQMRRAVRRLRGTLRALRPRLDRDWARPIEGDLRQLGRALGEVRDLDVVGETLRHFAGGLEAALGPLFGEVGRRRAAALAGLREALAGASHQAFRARLIEAARSPALRDGDEPARSALPELAAGRRRVLRRAWKESRGGPTAEALHEVRKRAKDLRQSVELAAGVLAGPSRSRAERYAKRLGRLVSALGAHQDAVVARGVVEGWSPWSDGGGAGRRVVGRLRRAAKRAREEAEGRWETVERKKGRRWMEGE